MSKWLICNMQVCERTAPAQKISLMHQGCTGGRGSDDGMANAEADALAIAVEIGVVTTDELLTGTVSLLAGRALTP